MRNLWIHSDSWANTLKRTGPRKFGKKRDFLHEFVLFYVRLLCSINFCFGSVEMRQFKNNCSGLKIAWGAAIYGMCITSVHFVVLHKFL